MFLQKAAKDAKVLPDWHYFRRGTIENWKFEISEPRGERSEPRYLGCYE
jgi:hypothetical protein